MKKILRYIGLTIVFLWFFIGGVTHFTSSAMFIRIVPPYIPFPEAAVFVSGLLELAGAIGIWIPRWRKAAGNGLIALTIAVTPANVYMWMNADLFPTIDPRLLLWRLPLQLVLLAVIWWSTREPAPMNRVDNTFG